MLLYFVVNVATFPYQMVKIGNYLYNTILNFVRMTEFPLKSKIQKINSKGENNR